MDNDIWVERYRPETLDDIVGQDETIQAVKRMLNNLPHLIFEGNAGTGKTTTAYAIRNELDCDFLELNSSEERGLDTVRDKIMSFAKHLSFNPAPFKIIFLNEADGITTDAQRALRPVMERYSHNCRFILDCNEVNKIIPAIRTSRCKLFRFKPVDEPSIIKRLRFIAEQEKIYMSISDKDYEELAKRCRGDLRRAINDLQMGDFGNHSEVEQIFL